jgi:hypothetical protein
LPAPRNKAIPTPPPEWLASLTAGTDVAVEELYDDTVVFSIYPIREILSELLVLNRPRGHRVYRANGRILGAKPCYIWPVTQEIRDEVEQRQLSHYLQHRVGLFGNLTLATLRTMTHAMQSDPCMKVPVDE